MSSVGDLQGLRSYYQCVKKAQEGLPYKRDGDARRLGLECKLQILVSLGVSGIATYCA